MGDGEKKKIYILLTRFPDNDSKTIEFLTNSFYTHASIGLEDDLNTFYSFVTKGFMIEKNHKVCSSRSGTIPMLYLRNGGFPKNI